MRLGTKLVIIGVVLLVLGLAQSPVKTTTTTECDALSGCNTYTESQPNTLRFVMLAIGGFMFSSGAGGWVGSYDAEQRQKQQQV